MNTLPLFYKKVVPLSKVQHQNLCISPIKDYNHTRNTNSLYIAAVEFLQASREYPIVFGIGNNSSIFPLVLLGLKNNENLYVGKKGEWLANYIPAYVRRYPFILAADKQVGGNFAVCIDESYPGFNQKKTATRLFAEDGTESPLLKQSVEFLKEYQNHIRLTNIFCNTINELKVLEPMQANMEKGGEKQSLGGFMCVNRKRLKELPAEKLSAIIRNDYLELIYAHLHSLANIDGLIKRVA
jgi:hypothetical protein